MKPIIFKKEPRYIEHFMIEGPIHHFLMLKANKSINTAEAYKRDILQFFNVKDIKDIKVEHIAKVNKATAFQWLFYLKNQKKYASSTITRKITSISALFDYFIRIQNENNKVIKFNPFSVLVDEKPKTKNKSKEFLTEEEMSLIYNNFDIFRLKDLRDKIMIGLLFTAGLRRFELAKIKIGDIKLYLNNIWTLDILGKGQKLEQEIIQPEIKELIDKYLVQTNRSFKDKEDYLFKGLSTNGLNTEKLSLSTINRIFKNIMKKNNIDKNITVHGARHSCITAAALNGATISELKTLARHESIKTTAIYMHEVDKFKNYAGNKINIFNR